MRTSLQAPCLRLLVVVERKEGTSGTQDSFSFHC